MSHTKDQVPLNGAYYGPSIPPQQHNHYKRSTGCCVLSTFLKVIIAIVVALGIAALVFWLVVRPTEVKFYVTSADLKQFNLTNRNTLNYDLTLNMAVRNPNKRIGVYYDEIDAIASYSGERFGWTSLPRFYQGHKNTTDIRAHFQGRQVITLNGNEIDTFDLVQSNNGFFNIDVKLYLRLRFKVAGIKTRRVRPDVECNLSLRLGSNGTVSRGFASQRCDFDF